jgi:hypothetical protein
VAVLSTAFSLKYKLTKCNPKSNYLKRINLLFKQLLNGFIADKQVNNNTNGSLKRE